MGVVLAGIVCGGLVLRPRFPVNAYYGEWNDRGSPYEPYHERVLSADIGGMLIAWGRIPDSRAAREHLRNRDLLRVRSIAARPSRALAQVFGVGDLRVVPGVLLLGVKRSDLVCMVTTSAPWLRLRQPGLRWPHALASIVAGDTLGVRPWVAGGGYCLQLNGRSHCGLAYTPDELW